MNLGLNGMVAAPPPLSTNVQPASVTGDSSHPSPNNNAPVNTYVPQTERAASPQRSRSQPPASGRKSVQFAEAPEVATVSDAAPAGSPTSSPERLRHKHRSSHSHGYEAGDDTDSTPDELRRRGRDHSSRAVEPASIERRHHRRRRSHEPTSSQGGPSSSSNVPDMERVTSPTDSEATVELPARFDDRGRKKAEKGDDPLADQVDNLLYRKGATGKLFGNFLEGLIGPDGRKKKGR